MVADAAGMGERRVVLGMRDAELRDDIAVLWMGVGRDVGAVEAFRRAVRGLHTVVSDLCDDATIDDDVLEPIDQLLTQHAFEMP